MSLNLEDIARLAGVSRSTVSRVINDDRNVSDTTREKVLKVIQEHNFRPNLAARTLVTQRTQVIGILIPHSTAVFTPYYFPVLLRGIGDTAHDRDYATLLLWGAGDREERFSRRLLQQNRLMDGLIIASATVDDPHIPLMLDLKVPFVLVERANHFSDQINFVTVDNEKAAQMAVAHLIKLGRRRIGHITGDLRISDGIDRLAGYRRALEEHDLPYDPSLVVEGVFTRRSGYTGMKDLLMRRVDAVFASSDDMAAGALQALQESGIRVPDDVALVGFDNLPTAMDVKPELTTVHQPIEEKGARATTLLLDLIEGRVESPQHILLPTHLVVRQSCGAQIAV
jgi:LacI family transcriptional regulator